MAEEGRDRKPTHGDVNVRSWGTRTRNFDRFPVGSVNCAVTISGSGRIEPSSEPKVGCESSDGRSIRDCVLPLELQRRR